MKDQQLEQYKINRAKDAAVKRMGYKDWDEMISPDMLGNYTLAQTKHSQFNLAIDYAIEEYASQQTASLQKQLEEQKEELKEERKSNHLLHEAMRSAEDRGVAKGREESKSRIAQLEEALKQAKQILISYDTGEDEEIVKWLNNIHKSLQSPPGESEKHTTQ